MCDKGGIVAFYQRISHKICLIISLTFIFLIQFYQIAISPYTGTHCRFQPTCSEYALGAIKLHGLVFGLWLMTKRLLKCHPACKGGYDPVPKKEKVK